MKKILIGMVIGFLLGSAVMVSAAGVFTATEASFPILVNGNKVTLAKPAVLINGSTYLPLRVLGDVLNVNVNWNEAAKRVEIGDSKAGLPNDQRVTFLNTSLMSAKIGQTSFTGDIRNNTDEQLSVNFTVTFYDASGNVIGTASGIASDVAPHSTKAISASIDKALTGVDRYTIVIDKVF